MMRWIVASLLLVPAAAGSTFSSEASFQGEGVSQADGWLFGVIDPAQTALFSLATGGGPARHHEQLHAHTSAGTLGDLYRLDRAGPEQDWYEMTPWTMSTQASPVAFLMHVPASDVSFAGNITWRALDLGQTFDADPLLYRLSTWDRAMAQPTVLAFLDGRLSLQVTTTASEWYALQCGACPDAERPLMANDIQSASIHTSLEIGASLEVTLNVTGQFHYTATSSDWLLNGGLRLPLFDGNATRTLVGTTQLQDLKRSPNGQLSANVDGEWTAAFNDESFDSTLLQVAGAATVAGAIALAFLGLIAKEILAAPLTNERRRLLYRIIQEQPGLHFRELQRTAGYGNGALVYSLQVLASSGLVHSRQVDGRRHYYAMASTDFHAEDVLLHGVAVERLRRAVLPFATAPLMTRRDLTRHLLSHGESRAAAYRLVRRLIQAGVLIKDKDLRMARWPALLGPPQSLAPDGPEGPTLSPTHSQL